MADPIIGKISVGDGATFTPSVNNSGVISWTNNKNLENPASVDIPQAVVDRYQLAPIASPAFTGAPTAPTPGANDNSTKLATTAYVQAELQDYLPLAGGTLTGNIAFSGSNQICNSADNWLIRINGGTDDNRGARFVASGMSRAGNYAGQFECVASNGTNTVTLKGTPDGTLTWDGNDVITSAGGTMTGNILFDKEEGRISLASAQNEAGRLRLLGGSGIYNGAQLLLSGKSHSSTAGQFQLGTHDGTNSASLIGKPDGTLTWDGKSVESVETSGSDYIRYKNGVQICKGYTGSVSSSETTVTYPQPFNSAPQVTISTNTLVNIAVRSITTTTFKVVSASGSNIGVRYIAFGYWK